MPEVCIVSSIFAYEAGWSAWKYNLGKCRMPVYVFTNVDWYANYKSTSDNMEGNREGCRMKIHAHIYTTILCEFNGGENIRNSQPQTKLEQYRQLHVPVSRIRMFVCPFILCEYKRERENVHITGNERMVEYIPKCQSVPLQNWHKMNFAISRPQISHHMKLAHWTRAHSSCNFNRASSPDYLFSKSVHSTR